MDPVLLYFKSKKKGIYCMCRDTSTHTCNVEVREQLSESVLFHHVDSGSGAQIIKLLKCSFIW